MFVLPALAAFAFASMVLASPHKRFDGLTVEVTSPSSKVASISDLTITAAVTNNNSEDVKVLKYGTVLDKLPTRSFSVSKDGGDVAFKGVKLSVQLSDSAYTTIKSGETVTVEHALTDLYDFSAAGTGKYSFAPLASFQVAGAADAISKVAELSQVTVTTDALEVEITGNVASPIRKRATNVCEDSDKKEFIDGSYTEAKELASLGSSYVSDNGASDSVYTDYFGKNDVSSVTDILDAVANENDSDRTLSCTDEENVCDGNVIAYTVIATTNIYFCDIFFDEVASTELCGGTTVDARNVRGGTTLHEFTHATSGTDDIIYGCDSDKGLSDSESIQNADNFNCFTTQVYADTEC